MWIGSLGPCMFWGTRAMNFSIYTTKMEGAGPKILGTGAKFKRVPCQKNCRVNRAFIDAIKTVQIPDDHKLVSFDVKSLFTSIPLQLALH